MCIGLAGDGRRGGQDTEVVASLMLLMRSVKLGQKHCVFRRRCKLYFRIEATGSSLIAIGQIATLSRHPAGATRGVQLSAEQSLGSDTAGSACTPNARLIPENLENLFKIADCENLRYMIKITVEFKEHTIFNEF